MTPPERHFRSPVPGSDRTLVLMLPGLDMAADDFVAQGLVDAAHKSVAALDIVTPDIHPDDYFEAGFADSLHESVVRPLQADYRRLVLMGISLGAMGALFYARAYDADGLVLLAPFLGNPGTIAAVERAGGLAAWTPGVVRPNELERGLLAWLKEFSAHSVRPWILLGYGLDDRFAASSRLLASELPLDRVRVQSGGHDWPTWRALWSGLIDHECLRGGRGTR